MKNDQSHGFDPKAAMDVEKFLGYEQGITHPHLIPSVLELITRPGLKILDVGGASGFFLNEIMTKAGYAVEATNLEFMAEYRDRQVNKQIRFLEGSILDSGIPDGSYDIVTFRHILHHLVADNIRQTLGNQQRALGEMARLVKPGGYLVFEEEVNRVWLCSRIVYFLSKWACRLGIKSDFYFGAGSVVVSFMTPSEIEAMLERLRPQYDLQLIKRQYQPWQMGWRWKLSVLMSWVGSLLCVIRVGRRTC
ncbi:MAG: class I SAM-dependent methyltransferase [Verrucomicrobiae bacterium]|nr:class I SAM-dependent methyltransferase [Verrucomicrobiae bacterium]